MGEELTALVTGGAEGIGACTVEKLASNGYQVFFCDINAAGGIERERQLKEKGFSTHFLHCDVSSYGSVKNMADSIRKRVKEIHLVVSNAGIANPGMSFPSAEVGEWEHMIRTNLSGSFYVLNSVIDLVSEGSCIILISSTRALQSEPNTLAYSASKGGLIALAHSLMMSLSSRRIRVNSILPGWVDTSEWKLPPRPPKLSELDHQQHPSKRVGKPEDVANLILFLSSRQAEWINGESIVIDGGMTRRMIYFDDEVLEEAIHLRKTGTL